jgi:hypothetical protein
MPVSIAGAKAYIVFNSDNGTNRCGTFMHKYMNESNV